MLRAVFYGKCVRIFWQVYIKLLVFSSLDNLQINMHVCAMIVTLCLMNVSLIWCRKCEFKLNLSHGQCLENDNVNLFMSTVVQSRVFSFIFPWHPEMNSIIFHPRLERLKRVCFNKCKKRIITKVKYTIYCTVKNT